MGTAVFWGFFSFCIVSENEKIQRLAKARPTSVTMFLLTVLYFKNGPNTIYANNEHCSQATQCINQHGGLHC